MTKLQILFGFLTSFLCVQQAMALEIQEYNNCCDASAAVVIPGTKYFLVGNDENAVMTAYKLGQSKPIDKKVNLAKRISGITEDTEMEIEAATTIGETSYWISSHSRKKGGKLDTGRHWLFALKLGMDGNNVEAKLIGEPYRNLLKDLVNDSRYKEFNLEDFSKQIDPTRMPKTATAFNIEGMTVWQNKKLLVGLRAPLDASQKAILVSIENPKELMDGKPVVFGDPVRLKLGGVGVRSIEYIPELKKYYIVSGPFDRASGFHLFSWNGDPGSDPKEVRYDFGNLNPEALFSFPGSKTLQLLSDDGKVKAKYDGKDLECGEALSKGLPVHFRAVSIQAP